MKAFAFVFARGGSKGVPNKNIRLLAGKPLLAYSVEMALSHPTIERCFVSTDSLKIAETAEKLGANVIERPVELAGDDSPEWLAWQHAIKWVQDGCEQFDCFVSLPATAPLRYAQDISTCIHRLNKETDVVVTMSTANRSPWFNMVNENPDSTISIILNKSSEVKRRQDCPVVYDLTTVAYVSRPEFILKHNNLWEGRVRGVVVPQERAVDIDTEMDFKIADFLMRERMAARS
jgi:CMP-N-acetylneuraminic acid synthetase